MSLACDWGSDRPPEELGALAFLLGTRLRSEGFSDQSVRRLVQLFERFAAHLEQGKSGTSLSDLTHDDVSGFVTAPTGSGSPPSVATMRLRRSAVRLLFRLARQLGLADQDPTLGIALPSRPSLRTRPLTDDEVLVCRSFSLDSLTATRRPAAWALAEATARTSEIPEIRAWDLHLDDRQVWIGGGSKTLPRWGTLTDWGAQQLDRRMRALAKAGSDLLLVSNGRGEESRQASSCIAIAETLRRAGIHSDPGVRPGSVPAWAGAKAYAEGTPIEEVAQLLGVRSLDRAASIIGLDLPSPATE